MTRFVFCFLALAVLVASDYCGDWTAIDLQKDVPLALATDKVEVYYMAAPLLYCGFLDKLTWINGYHGGLGMKNLRTNYTFTINFDGYPSFKATFLPIITRLPNATYNLQWQNFGKVFLYNGINDTYWHSLGPFPKNRELVATMNGVQFNSFHKWLSVANDTFQFYNPWFVYADFPSQPWIAGFECFQFVFNAVQKIQALGATMNPLVKTLKVSLGTAYSKMNVTKVNFFDPAWQNQIVDFFLLLEENWNNLGVIGFLEELVIILATGDSF